MSPGVMLSVCLNELIHLGNGIKVKPKFGDCGYDLILAMVVRCFRFSGGQSRISITGWPIVRRIKQLGESRGMARKSAC